MSATADLNVAFMERLSACQPRSQGRAACALPSSVAGRQWLAQRC